MTISVIIPVYNGEGTLSETLLSVSSQMRMPDEVIIINDGSTDSSPQIAEDWKLKQDFPVKIVSQENQGLAAARNRGITKASSDFLAFLDDDDIWLPLKLAHCERKLSQQAPDLLFHSAKTFGGTQSTQREAQPVETPHDIIIEGKPIIPSCVMIRKEVAEKFPFTTSPEFSLAEDLHLWLKLLQNEKKLVNLPEVLCLYRETGGISGDISAHLKCVFAVLNHYHHQGLFSKKILSKAIVRKHYEAARYLHKAGDFKQAQVHYQLADGSTKTQVLSLLNRLKVSL